MNPNSVRKQNQFNQKNSALASSLSWTLNRTLARNIARTAAIAMLSLASIQAAAGPGGHGGPSAEERAKMDAAIQAACGADFTNFCPAATDHHAKMDCLRSNEANLSSTCSAFVTEMKAHRPPGPPPDQRPDDSSSSSASSAAAGS